MESVLIRKSAIAERKSVITKSQGRLDSKCKKDAKQQAKTLSKEGWKSAIGTNPIEEQLYDLLLKQYEQKGNYPMYIIGRSQAVSDDYNKAYKIAESRVYADIASNISAEIISLAEDALVNKQLTATDVETVSKYMSTTQQSVRQNMGKIDIVFEIYREANGKTEFQIGASYDVERLQKTIRKALENETTKQKEIIEKLLNKKELQ